MSSSKVNSDLAGIALPERAVYQTPWAALALNRDDCYIFPGSTRDEAILNARCDLKDMLYEEGEDVPEVAQVRVYKNCTWCRTPENEDNCPCGMSHRNIHGMYCDELIGSDAYEIVECYRLDTDQMRKHLGERDDLQGVLNGLKVALWVDAVYSDVITLRSLVGEHLAEVGFSGFAEWEASWRLKEPVSFPNDDEAKKFLEDVARRDGWKIL